MHGATLDGAVRHKDQVVAAALAAHPEGRDPVLVGDRAHDVLGAAAHGLPCIGAGWGPAEDGELARAGAAAIAATPAEVPGLLSRASAADVWSGSVAGHLTAHDRTRAAPRPRPRLQPQGLAGAVQQ